MAPPFDAETRRLAQIVWDYACLRQPLPAHTDFLLVLGTTDLRVPEHAAKLVLEKNIALVVCTGGVDHFGRRYAEDWPGGLEAEVFRDRMMANGVPAERIIAETTATNTGENFTRTRELLRARGIQVKSGLIYQLPGMERRALSTGQQQWPEVNWQITAPAWSYAEFMASHDEAWQLSVVVGDVARFEPYAAKGLMVPTVVPAEVKAAMQGLIERGFDQRLPRV